MEKKQNVPALRFPGFSGEWDMKYFKKLVVLERGGSPRPIDDYITTDDNGLNWVKIGDAPANGSYITHTAEKIKPEGLSKTRQVFPGDLILSNSMSFGKPYIMGIPGCIHDGWLLIRDEKHHFDLKYLCVLLGIPAMLRQYRALAAGSTVSNLNKELVGNTHVYIPDIVEQKKIGSFFDKLDQSIYWCENKIQKLQQFRQAMLTKLFPREGAAEPELRFRGFSGKWKRCQLGDVATFINGRAYARDELLSTGKYKVLRVGNFYTNDKWYYSNLELGEKYYAHKGDLLYTWSATFGPHIWDGDTVIYHYHIWKVELSEYLDKLFALQLLELDRDALLSDTNGSTMIHITMSDMKNRWITISENIEEQKLIGLFFYRLNLFISLQQKKLERMQRLKAALLEKLFV